MHHAHSRICAELVHLLNEVESWRPAARRVQESIWHPSQHIETDEHGGCVLRLEVSSTFELRPFIRQWGENCEVLEPGELRDEIAGELKRAAANYNR